MIKKIEKKTAGFKINLWKKYFLRKITEERLWNIRLGLHHCGSEQAAWGWKIRLIKQNNLGFSVVNKYKLDLSGLDLSTNGWVVTNCQEVHLFKWHLYQKSRNWKIKRVRHFLSDEPKVSDVKINAGLQLLKAKKM